MLQLKALQLKKILGITVGNKIKFDKRAENVCKRRSRKLNAIAMLANCMDLGKKFILMIELFMSKINYCPVVSMFHCRLLNNKITKLHERCLKNNLR